jgi:hypothetical protein
VLKEKRAVALTKMQESGQKPFYFPGTEGAHALKGIPEAGWQDLERLAAEELAQGKFVTAAKELSSTVRAGKALPEAALAHWFNQFKDDRWLDESDADAVAQDRLAARKEKKKNKSKLK